MDAQISMTKTTRTEGALPVVQQNHFTIVPQAGQANRTSGAYVMKLAIYNRLNVTNTLNRQKFESFQNKERYTSFYALSFAI